MAEAGSQEAGKRKTERGRLGAEFVAGAMVPGFLASCFDRAILEVGALRFHVSPIESGAMAKAIGSDVFRSKRTVALARWLIGKHLVRRFADGRVDARLIVETEAYCGERDLACHARAGRTRRTEVMYGAGGLWYVYLCYGIHEMLNLVVGPPDWPAAILIRGVERARGPGRVTKALAIDRKLNNTTASEESGLWIEDRNTKLPRGAVQATKRIGIDYAGPIWTAKHWRFVLPETKTLDRNGKPIG